MPTDDLLDKKRKLLEKKKQLLAIQQSVMHKESMKPSQTEAALRHAAQGLTFGLADELAALSGGIKSSFEVGGPLENRAEAFKIGQETTRAENEYRRNEARQAYPKTAIGSEVLGGMTTGLGTFKALSNFPAIAKLPPAQRILGIGGLEGAAYGAGIAEPDERLAGAGSGALFGAIATPIGLGLTTTAMSVLRPVARRLGEALLGTPKDQAVKRVMQALDAEDITPDEAFTLIRALGKNATIADLGDAPGRLARSIAGESGPAASQAKRFLDFRQIEAQNQFRQAARRATGASDFDKGVIEVINGAESAAAPIYKEVFEEVLDVTEPMLQMMSRPAMKQAKAKAVQKLQNAGFSTDIVHDVTDVRYMDAIKRALGDQERAALKAGRTDDAMLLGNLRREFVAEIDAQVPRYAEARSLFAGESAMRDAADVGRTIFKGNKTSVSDAAEMINKMGESELQAARYGFLEWLSDELAGQSVKRNTLVNKFSDVPKFRQMAQLLFPSQQHVDDFLRSSQALSKFGETRNLITGGSPTARIQADRAGLNPGLLRVMGDAAFSQLGGLSSALRLIRGNTTLTPEIAEEIGKIILNPKVIPRQLQRGPARLFDIPKMNPVTAAGATGGFVAPMQGGVFDELRRLGLMGQ